MVVTEKAPQFELVEPEIRNIPPSPEFTLSKKMTRDQIFENVEIVFTVNFGSKTPISFGGGEERITGGKYEAEKAELASFVSATKKVVEYFNHYNDLKKKEFIAKCLKKEWSQFKKGLDQLLQDNDEQEDRSVLFPQTANDFYLEGKKIKMITFRALKEETNKK